MLIKEPTLQHWIDYFYGYGSWNARMWFVAHEEGGGDLPEEVAEKLNYFLDTHPSQEPTLCDIRELYRRVSISFEGSKAGLFRNLYEYRFADHAVKHAVWKNLIGFLHGYRGVTPPDALVYQRSVFASPSVRNEALIRLYPLPAPHNHGWYYSWLDAPQFPFLKSRTTYEQHVYPRRIKAILQNIATYMPEVVLMYGMNNITALKQSVQEAFPATKFKMVKAIKQQIPQHHRADLNTTTLIITTQIPALRHNRAETGFDWEAFGRLVRGNL